MMLYIYLLFEYMQIACKCNKLNSFSELLNALFIK